MLKRINKLKYALMITILMVIIYHIKVLNVKNNWNHLNQLSTNAKLVDLSKPLEPWSLYQNISCQETKSINTLF